MQGHELYYRLKPFLPRAVRVALRRRWAARLRRKCGATWPIDPSSANPPERWPGWPGDKDFALVLTHDVEGPDGIRRVKPLAELEHTLGFVSSYNFVPEGGHEVPASLREWLAQKGFEVGVHDLEHDGRLFTSSAEFAAKAQRINVYLRHWQAEGFRSAFMLRRLEWLHEIDLSYDSSTFDTDPFEPVPVGVGSIFPFWVNSPAHTRAPGTIPPSHPQRGYVELPYTLAQDSTLYLILGETTPALWFEKLAWIAARGGMALVNVHPDYLDFSNGRANHHAYPARLYTEFLQHVHAQFSGRFWNPRAAELARWYRDTMPRSETRSDGPTPAAVTLRPSSVRRFQGIRAAAVVYSHYLDDARPRREAEALAESGAEVDVYCLGNDENPKGREEVNGVTIHRLPVRHRRGSRLGYLWRYFAFLLAAMAMLAHRTLRRPFHLVHVHNMPDILVFCALFPRFAGAKIILDLHDPMPELMHTIYRVPQGGLTMRAIKLLEKCSIGFSHTVVTVNHVCKRLFAERSCRAEKISVVMNSPDERMFSSPPLAEAWPAERDPSALFVIMYHGSLVERHGLDLAVRALGAVLKVVPGARLRIYGRRTSYLDQVLNSAREAGLSPFVEYAGPKTLAEIVDAIRECHLGIIPNRRSVFTLINTPTRIFEYLSQGKPVVAPRSEGILDYFGPDDLFFFELGDADELARQIMFAFHHPAIAQAKVKRGQEILRQHSWLRQREHFLDAAAQLLSRGGTKPRTEAGLVTPHEQPS